MKILHINWSGKLGGAEKFVYTLAIRQLECSSPPNVTIAYMNKKLVLGKKAEEKGIRVIEFNMRSGLDIINFLGYIFFIIRERFDVIHDHNGPPLVRLSKLFSPQSIFIQHIHGTKFGTEKWESLRVLVWKRVTRGLVDHYIANSEHTKNIASNKEKIPLSHISVIYNGVALDEFIGARCSHAIRDEFGFKEDDWIVGIIGNLTPAKGIDKFIRIAKKVEGAKFVIVGDGELRGELEHLSASLGLKDRLIFTGTREDIPAILLSFNVFLLTSNWEAFGISLIEAMACGVPVVAFRIGGIPEVVSEGCGLLIPPSSNGDDHIDEAAKSIIFLKENKNVAQKLGIEGQKLVKEKFDIQKVAKKVEVVYHMKKSKK